VVKNVALTDPNDYLRRNGLAPASSSLPDAGDPRSPGLTSPDDYLKRTKAARAESQIDPEIKSNILLAPMRFTQRIQESAPPKEEPKPLGQRIMGTVRDVGQFLSDFPGAFTDSATFGLSDFASRKLGAETLEEQRARDARLGGKVGEFAGYLAPGAAADRLVVSIGGQALRNMPKVAQGIVRGGAAGAIDAAAQEAGDVAFREGTFDPENIALGAAAGGVLGGAVDAAALGVRSFKERGLRNAVKDFERRINALAETPTQHPADRLVQELPPASGVSRGDELASNFRRWENLQKQYEEAVEAQYQLLKSQRDARGGVAQGTLIRNPVTGEVVDRVGRTSSNPRWYRDFYAENGRVPTNKDLRALAEEHVKKGYMDDDAGFIPPWRPFDIQDIDNELANIRVAMEQVNDPAERSALVQLADTLESSRAAIRQQLPEGVQARVARTAGSSDSGMSQQSSSKAADSAPPRLPPADKMLPDVQAKVGHQAAPFQPVPLPKKPKKTISRTQLVNNIKKHLGVVIDTGRTGHGRGVLGIYKVQPEVIRTAKHQDYDSIAHEIGHHLVKKYRLLDPQYENELIAMMDAMGEHPFRTQYKRHEWFDEGVAEYMRVFLQDPQRARQLAPKFSAFLERTLPKDVQKGIKKVQQDIRIWLEQGDYERAKGKIDFEGETTNQNASRSKLYTRFFDDLHPIKLAEIALQGAVQLGSKSIYKLARLSRGVGEQAKMAVTRGIFDRKGNKLSDGLQQIVRPLEEIGMKEKDLGVYLAAKHAQDLKRLHGKEIPFTDSEIAEVLARWDNNPVVRKVQREIVQYNNALLDILVDAQILDAKTVAKMRQMYPNYVPFLRYFDDDAVAGFKNGGYGSARGFANVLNPTKRMTEEGSSRTIINPLESMVKNTFLVMNAAAKNRVGLQLAELAKIDGAGAWVEAVPGGSSAKEHIVNVWQNGKQTAYKIRDPELYNAMLSLDNESVNSLVKFLGGAAGMLRAGATLTPEFMIRNAFRDVAGAIINSTKYGFNPLDFFKGFFHVVTKSDVFEKFVNSGGAMSTMMALDRDANREALQAIFKLSLKDKAMNVVTSPAELAKYLSGYKLVQGTVGVLRKGAEISELSTKVGAFNKTLRKTGDIEEAAYTARDLMDFNRAGSAIRQANRAVAFLNASLQGTDKMARAFMENKASFLTRAFTTLVLPSTMLYYWNRSLPDDMRAKYDNIPQWQKDSFFIIGIPGINEFVRIPKPFEAGMLFATSTDRMLDWLQGNDPEAWNGYGRATLESMTPPVLFTALSPLLEAMTNHSFFRNAPVVPQGEQRLEKKDQYGIYTSELAKEIGAFMDSIGLGNTNAASPRIIDNTLKGYTAGLGQYGVDLIDQGIEAVRGKNPVAQPSKKWTEDPLFRSFFVSTAGGGQVRDEFYKKWNKLDAAKASADFNEKQLPANELKDYARMKPYKSAIDKMMRQYKEIQRSKRLSAEQKRSMLDDLDGKMNEAASKALGK
jgi:hypothetical protein